MIATSDPESSISFAEAPAVRLAAPEVLEGSTAISKEADIFSFAMVVVEVFTGAAPFVHSPPTTVAVRILAGKRPERPEHPSLTDEFWDFNQRCWDQKPLLRPGVSEVVSYLQTALAIERGRADGTDVSTIDHVLPRNNRQREPSRRLCRESTAGRWLPAFCKFQRSSNHQTTLDKSAGMDFGDQEAPLNAQHAPSGLHSFLRGAAIWLSHFRLRFTRNRDGHLDDSSEKHGAARESEDRPPSFCSSSVTLTPTTSRLPCLPLRRSNKCMYQ